MATTPIYALPYPLETDSADVPRDIQALANRLEAVLPGVGTPTGAGVDWYAATAPAGFLLCDGSAVSRTTYSALFSVIGVSWGGGDGVNTFNLPDCRGRVLVGLMPGGNAEVNALGANDGTAAGSRRVRHAHSMGTLAASHNITLPAHGHSVGDPGHGHASITVNGFGFNGGTGGGASYASINSSGSSGVAPGWSTNSVGTGISVGNPTSYPAVNGGVTLGGTVGVSGGTADGPSFVVANKAIKT
jgi:microcystin-dependent protein